MPTPLVLPKAIPLFPLPNVVLFPGQALPLHIFEERYKLMTRHVLESEDRLLGMGLYKEGGKKDQQFPPVYPVGCVGQVGEVERLPDGRYNFILHGLLRVEVQGYEQRTPYRIATVRPLPSAAVGAGDFQDELAQLSVSIQRVLPIVSRNLTWEQVQPVLAQLPDAGAVSDFVGAYLPVDVHVRQELLETLDVEQRLHRILDLLGGLLSVLN